MPARKEQWQTKLLSQILLEVNFARGMKNFPPAKFLMGQLKRKQIFRVAQETEATAPPYLTTFLTFTFFAVMLSFRPSSSSPSTAAASLLVLSAAAAALLAASAADASPLPAAAAPGEGKSPTQRPRSKDSGTSGMFRGGRFIDRGKVLKRVALQENNSSHTYGIAHVVSKPECSPFGKCRDIQCRPEATAGERPFLFLSETFQFSPQMEEP